MTKQFPFVNKDQPIDAVVLWVDGSDPEWKLERSKYWGQYLKISHSSNSNNRFISCDELLYCLRSIYCNADWIRYIYVVTCGQKPNWLMTDSDKIKLINHNQIIDSDLLPTFNSCAIEMHLHKIPGLSEAFLYLNDDCFITSRTTIRTFFNVVNKAYFYSCRKMCNSPDRNDANSFNWTIYNNQCCLDELFGPKIRPRPDHQGYILFKKAFEYVWNNAPHYVNPTRKQKFRIDGGKCEKTLNAYIFAVAGLELGYYDMSRKIHQSYYTVENAKKSYQLILAKPPVLLCINNACTDDDKIFVNKLMSTLIPNQAPWENLINFPKYEQFTNTCKTNMNKILCLYQNFRNINQVASNRFDTSQYIDRVPYVNNNVKKHLNNQRIANYKKMNPQFNILNQTVPVTDQFANNVILISSRISNETEIGKSNCNQKIKKNISNKNRNMINLCSKFTNSKNII